MSGPTIHQAAAWYVSQGVRVLGCGQDKRPLGRWRQLQSARPSATLAALGDPSMLGIITGDRFDVVDVDHIDALADLHRANGDAPLPATYGKARTPSGGFHLFIPAQGRRNGTDLFRTARPHGNVDYRGRGGYVVAAPSVGYEWIEPLDLTRDIDPDQWERLLASVGPCASGQRQMPGRDASAPLGPHPWIAAKLEAKLDEVSAAAVGTRNSTLNNASMDLGHYLPEWLDEGVVRERLLGAARRAGLDDGEAKATILSGLSAGRREPRNPPPGESPGRPSRASASGVPVYHEPDEPVPHRRLKLTRASDIRPKRVVWAWRDDYGGRIPAGELTTAGGREGTGKSSFWVWIASQVTRGTLPGSFHGTPRNVFWCSVEESWEHALVPRLLAAGADLSRVYRLDVQRADGDEVMMNLPTDNALLEEAIVAEGAALVVIDPLMSLLHSQLNANSSQQVRQALDPLAKIAQRTGVVIAAVAHFNKGQSTDAAQLITGAGAWKDAPRTIFGFAKDRDGNRMFTQVKNSLGQCDGLPSYRYRIESATVDTDDGPTDTARFVLDGTTHLTVGDVLAAQYDDPASDAEEALLHELRSNGGAIAAKDGQRLLREFGVPATGGGAQRMRARLGIKATKTAMAGGWVWTLTEAVAVEESAHGTEGPSVGFLESSDSSSVSELSPTTRRSTHPRGLAS